MTIALATLATRLQAQVPARDSVPGDYNQIVKDAVWQYSQDAPILRAASLSIAAGTAAYNLASDFLYLVELESLNNPAGLIISDSGLIPVSANREEWYEVSGGQITFAPPPTYTLTRSYRYAAAHILNESGAYERLTENGARIALLYAQHVALALQASAVAGDGWRYRIGDEEVDKKGQGQGLVSQAQAMLAQYQQALRGVRSGAGLRATYSVLGE